LPVANEFAMSTYVGLVCPNRDSAPAGHTSPRTYTEGTTISRFLIRTRL
jgi:hypothetical protein